MGASPTPKPSTSSDSGAVFQAALAAFAPQLPLAVAYSGGADSTALLLACAQRWPGQVAAIHINHQLQAAATDFEHHCENFCARFAIPLAVRRVQAGHAPGESPEAAARAARYHAIAEFSRTPIAELAIKSIAIAQHADDQAETLLLALSRGAGLPGLSAMPAQWQRAGLDWHRPLLTVPAAALRAWLQTQPGVGWIEDPSNSNPQFTRNRMRAQLLPALDATLPQFRATFARSAQHAAQAQALLDDLAQLDAQTTGMPPALAALQRLSAARQANLVRYWLRSQFSVSASAVQMQELLAQIAAATTRGHRLHIKVANGFMVREGQHLAWYNQ